jgi:hypothetical protein
MIKRILLTLALAASIGGALAACNTPAATSNPGSSTSGGGASLAPSLDTGGSEAPSESMAVPSAS